MNLRSDSAQARSASAQARSATGSGHYRLRDKFREETIRAVLGAAEAVFAREGLHGASMGQIAEKAGVAVGTLYNHFQDREALLGALLDQLRQEMLEKVDRRRKELAERPFHEQLDGFLGVLFDHFERYRAFSDLALVCQHETWSKQPQTVRALYERADAIMKVGHREKVLRADPLRSFPAMLLGLVRATLLREKYGAPPIEASKAVSSVSEFFVKGAGR